MRCRSAVLSFFEFNEFARLLGNLGHFGGNVYARLRNLGAGGRNPVNPQYSAGNARAFPDKPPGLWALPSVLHDTLAGPDMCVGG